MSSELNQIRVFHLFFTALVLLLISPVEVVKGLRDEEVDDRNKIEFFYEILENIETPLISEKWLKCGDSLIMDKAFYKTFNEDMFGFHYLYERGELLSQNAFFGSLLKAHHIQMRGLYSFLYQPHDWETYVNNACWARRHLNAHMFVYAFTTATMHRRPEHGMLLPKIQEIIPRYFIKADFLYTEDSGMHAELKALQRNMNEHYSNANANPNTIHNDNIMQYKNDKRDFYMENFKYWQWWKFMGYDSRQWYEKTDSLKSREDLETNALTTIEYLWKPLDYTRDTQFLNVHTKISYLTEDMDWNAYWYYLNTLYVTFLQNNTLPWSRERRGEFWIYCTHQLLSRYDMELVSNGIITVNSKISDFELNALTQNIRHGCQPDIRESNGIGFQERENFWALNITKSNIALFNELQEILERLENVSDYNAFITHDHLKISLNSNDSIESFANLLQANSKAVDQQYHSYWFLKLFTLFSSERDDENLNEHLPNALLNFESMLRDPLSYMLLRKITNLANHYRLRHLNPYSSAELGNQRIRLRSFEISKLTTYFELHDVDVTNALHYKNKNAFSQQRFFGRQQRLTHEPFHFNLTIASDDDTTALLRIFLAPLQDNFGQLLSQSKFMDLIKMPLYLKAGLNIKTIQYDDYFPASNFRLNHFNMYLKSKNQQKSYLDYDPVRYCGLPPRLLLPKGWRHGLPMQMFVMVTKSNLTLENFNVWWQLCLPLESEQNFGYPFDRTSNLDKEPLRSNMLLKSVKIFYIDKFANIRKNWN